MNELLNPEGLRVDGRRFNELRMVSGKMGIFENSDGSAMLQQGNTTVYVTVFGPYEGKKSSDKALINVEYSLSPGCSVEWKKRSKNDRRLHEISSTIKQTFEAVIQLELFPHSQIDIFVQVVNLDGGALHTSINCTTLALIDAGIPLIDLVCACSAGYIDNSPLLDLNDVEERSSYDVPSFTVGVRPRDGKVVCLNLDMRLNSLNFNVRIDFNFRKLPKWR